MSINYEHIKYPINPLDTKQQAILDNNFVYHAPLGLQPMKYEEIRHRAKDFAEFLMRTCPQSRELSVALTELETSVFWANAAIARNE